MEFTRHGACATNNRQDAYYIYNKLKLIENYKVWKESVFNSAKGLNYRMFKTDLVSEHLFSFASL